MTVEALDAVGFSGGSPCPYPERREVFLEEGAGSRKEKKGARKEEVEGSGARKWHLYVNPYNDKVNRVQRQDTNLAWQGQKKKKEKE